MIHRDEHKTEFTRISWSALRDERLSFEARGFLAFILTMPDSWDFNINGLVSITGTSKSSVMRLVKELKSCGYISQEKVHDKGGRFGSYIWHITEVPKNRSSVSPKLGFTEVRFDRSSDSPKFGKSLPIKNDIYIKNDISIRNDIKEKKVDGFSEILSTLPPELQDTFQDFIKMRKTIKAPMTEKALKLAIDKCRKLGNDNPETMRSIVEQSILNSWKGLFPLKEETKKSPEPIWENPFTKLRREEGFI